MSHVDELLRAANPVPDPGRVADPTAQAAALTHALTAYVPAHTRVHPGKGTPGRGRVRRGVLLATATAVAIAAVFAAGELGSSPRQVAVLPALADELTGPGVLHVVERTSLLSAGGHPVGDVHLEESWTLLTDPTVSRWRIGTGPDAEEGTTGSLAEPGGAPVVDELPVATLARDAAAGRIPSTTGPVIGGRSTIEIPADDGTWYIAQDVPELVRRELRTPDGRLQRTDYVTFDVLADTAANRALLDQDAADGRVVTDAPPAPGP